MKHFKYIIGTMDKFRINIMMKSSTIPLFFLYKTVRIYKGKKWCPLNITAWHVGYKFGQYLNTRKYVQFKSKSLKKSLKKNKQLNENIPQIEDPKIQQLRLVRLGELKKRIGTSSDIEKGFSLSYKKVLF